jgi:predicted dehydrogenase
MRIGLAGYGYFGEIIHKTLAEMGIAVAFVADPQVAPELESGAAVVDITPHLPDLDALVIATPPQMHMDLALRAITADTHVFCEKPVATSVREAELLIHEATARGLVVHADHSLVFCPKRIEAMSHGREILAVRENGERSKHNITAVWDLLIHEIAAAVVAMRAAPDDVELIAAPPGRDRVEVKLSFRSRVVTIRCENGSARVRELYVNSDRIEGTCDPLVEEQTPVTRSLGEFFEAVNRGRPSRSGLSHILSVTRVLEQVDALIREGQ